MHLNKLFFITSVLCFCSCDQLKDTPLPADDLNKTSGAAVQKEPKELEKPNQTKDLIKDDEPTNTSDIIATPLPLPPPPKEPEPKPIQPEFSEELLKAVNNWRSIPRSVFPLSSVTIKDTVEFIAKSATGEIVARAIKQPGEEVVALGLVGQELILSINKSGKMRGKISIGQTDFKQGVAYLFELRKQQRADYERKKSELAEMKESQLASSSNAAKTGSSTSNEEPSLFEDLPVPGDFGHGKFCICKDCREKRLAATGSMK